MAYKTRKVCYNLLSVLKLILNIILNYRDVLENICVKNFIEREKFGKFQHTSPSSLPIRSLTLDTPLATAHGELDQ